MHTEGISLSWLGPFGWPSRGPSSLGPIPATAGVYLLCFAYADGFLIYGAGVTSRLFTTRLREHTRKYESGAYTILYPEAASQGVRQELWHGWAEARRPERIEEFARRREELVGAARRQLCAFRIFVAELPAVDRLPNRVEAAVMDALYSAPAPFSALPDRGMYLSRRNRTQKPVIARHRCASTLHALPESMEV